MENNDKEGGFGTTFSQKNEDLSEGLICKVMLKR